MSFIRKGIVAKDFLQEGVLEYGVFVPLARKDIPYELNDDFEDEYNFELANPDELENEIHESTSENTEEDFVITEAQNKKIEKELKKIKTRHKFIQNRQIQQGNNSTKVTRPIGITLIVIISIIVIIALGTVTGLVSLFVTQDIKTNAEENNLTINSRTASDCDNRVNNILSATGMFVDILSDADTEAEINNAENILFTHNKEIIGLYHLKKDRMFYNSTFFSKHELSPSVAKSYFEQERIKLSEIQPTTVQVQNVSPFFNTPLLALFFGIGDNAEDFTPVCVLFSSEGMGESFSSGSVNQSFLVNGSSDILIHGDLSLMMQGENAAYHPMVVAMLQGVNNNAQISYIEEGEEYIGAYRRLNSFNGGVITTVKTSIVLEGIKATTRRNIYITIAVLSLSILVIYLFSRTLSRPLKQLTSVVNEINMGNFNTELFNELTTTGKNEIGVLMLSTHNEREILNTFTKLTNKGVTSAIIKKEIDFEPHLKDITIFFSDIRGFTAISDGFKNRFGEQSAAEIIGFLNDYMSRMVTCITRTGGIVDKFEGDAIMACWGTLRNDDLAWERLPEDDMERIGRQVMHDSYVKADALSAITSCIAMRYSLMKYNKDAEEFTNRHKDEPLAQYKPHIRIGAGLNSGRATVGFMGSFDKMEFTSIGDPVNFASRTEASNKPCGTDILITEDTYELLKYDYIKCKENNYTIAEDCKKSELVVEQIPVEFEVKGKGKQHFYGVVNMPNFDIEEFFWAADPSFELDTDCERAVGPKGPKTLSEMRSLLGIPEPDFEQVNLDAEENKIKVAAS